MNEHDPRNRTLWLTAAVLGAALAVAGFHHGLFEALQGNTSTGGMFINSIGPDHVRWEHGTDPAFTVIPNFLVTGLASMVVSVAIMAWCFTGLRRRHGSSVLLGLFLLLTLVGGGMGHILFFVALWGYATRIRRPLAQPVRWLPEGVRRGLAGGWAVLTVSAAILFLAGLEVSVFGVGSLVMDPDRLLTIDWSILLASFLCLNLACLGAMIRDAEPRPVEAGP